MEKSQYRVVLESLYETSKSVTETYVKLHEVSKKITDPILLSKLSVYKNRIMLLPEGAFETGDIRLRFLEEEIVEAKKDLESYVHSQLSREKDWQDKAVQSGWGPLQEMAAQNKKLEEIIEEQKEIIKSFQKGTFELYKEGGDIKKAAEKHLPSLCHKQRIPSLTK